MKCPAQELSANFFKCCALAIALVFIAETTNAGVDVQCNNKLCRVKFEGEITAETEAHFRAIRAAGNRIESLELGNSPGGNVDAAIAIGRMLRKDQTFMRSPVGSRCISACVLLAAGPVTRSVADNWLVIHTLYSPEAFSNYAEADSQISGSYMKVEEYLREMHISTSLVDAMRAVPSHATRSLTLDEAKAFGYTVFDPVYAEMKSGQLAAKLGITRAELDKRVALARKRCDPISAIPERLACLRELGLTD